MRESLRSRLLMWHLATGAAIIAAFGASVCLFAWRTRLAAVDATLSARAALLADAVRPTVDGRIDLILGPGLRYEDAPELYHALWTHDGMLVDRSDATLTIPYPEEIGARIRDGRRELASTAASGVLVLVGTDLEDIRNDIWSLAGALALMGSGILVLSVAGGWWFTGRALEPLQRITRTARRMTDGDLAARIPVDAIDTEVGEIAHALNSAFDRLHGAIERQRRFTADASHELRTPLATLSAEVQWALARPRTAEELRSSIEVCERAVGRMQAVIERLLFLARGEAVAIQTTSVRVDEVTTQAIEHVQALAYAAGLTLTSDTTPATIRADPEQLLEAITNVLTNAIRYNVPDGTVHIEVRETADAVELRITDTGIGISPADLPLIFDAFFRGDPARSRDTGGAGLGLAVARSVVERHGGSIRCTSSPGAGTTVWMTWQRLFSLSS